MLNKQKWPLKRYNVNTQQIGLFKTEVTDMNHKNPNALAMPGAPNLLENSSK